MDCAQNQVARGIDTAHIFGIATVVRMVRAGSLAEGLHEHVMGDLLDGLLVGIDNVPGRRGTSGKSISHPGRGPFKIPGVNGPGVTVDVTQRGIGEPGAIACKHGIGGPADSLGLIAGEKVVAYYKSARCEQEQFAE
jgi:hypothetical protein